MRNCAILCLHYSRNQPSLGLLRISVKVGALPKAAQDGTEIDIDLGPKMLTAGGKGFAFDLSEMEKSLRSMAGVAPAFNNFGKQIFGALTNESRRVKKSLMEAGKARPLW